MADELTRCKACNGRGYFRCECWPADCICGADEDTCWECNGDGWIDPSYDDFEDDQSRHPPRPGEQAMRPTEKQIEAAARIIYDAHPLMETDPEDGSSWYVTFDDVKNSYPATYEDLCERVAALSAALAVEAGTVLDAPENADVKASFLEDGYALTTSPASSVRPCTCHPDDNPPSPCAERYAYSECVAAAYPASSGVEGEAVATHRHKKRGSEYVLIGIGKMQVTGWYDPSRTISTANVDMREVAIYRSVDDGSLWVRPREEFEDGRYEALPAAPTLPASSVKGEEGEAEQ